MVLFDDFEAFKRKVGQLEALVNQSKGAYKETMARLKKEFKSGTLKEAKVLLEKMRKKELQLTKTYLAQRKRFEDDLRSIKCDNPELEALLKSLRSSTPKPSKPARKKWKP